MGTRSGAERDAITVEIVFALMTGILAAGLVFAAVAVPTYYWRLPPVLLGCAAGAAGLVFVARIVHVLRGFRGRPGLTGPDS
ncbi:DUF6332 family protein [Streptomyces paludis]|uniref:Uncharacterized protein n=1 Tax=Streptomyces paludis TaxID=2282738 RepID=A0A345HIK4_9ACTN|nr:DUF6332 family protein [Streptomyces paludis]AXG76528.1 hypothetical protein DVK44_01290 [Streptomyces paludis]